MIGWTPENTERARQMWFAGKSAAFIASEIGGMSRNAVIGKADREKWERGATQTPSDDAWWRRVNEYGDAKLLRALALHQLGQVA